jgi:hypothetical protein
MWVLLILIILKLVAEIFGFTGSVWASTQIRCIWPQDRVIGQPDCGMFNAGHA